MPESNTLQPGHKFGNGRFVLVRFLGRGGMGEVWLAQDERLYQPVALKFLPVEIRGDAVSLDDLRRETARSQRLTHPNIVRIHDLHEETDGMAFIVMEYVNGLTLAELRLQQPNRVFAWELLRPLLEQLCAALNYAHGEKVIHRDLKPANAMVDDRGRLKLADFGIAAVASDSISRVSAQTTTSGTLTYMSPQQLKGKRPRPTDDIYALGATLYELLTSKPPFYTGDLTHQILCEPPEPMDERKAGLEIQNDIPPDAAALIMACLAKEPEQRPQSVLAVAEWIGLEVVRKPSLQALSKDVSAGTMPAAKPVPESPVPPAAPLTPGSRRKRLLTGVLFGALLLLAAGGWYWTKHQPRETAPIETQAKANRIQPTEVAVPVIASKPNQTEPPSTLAPAADEDGFISLFNGHDLSGWDGDPRFWAVEDNAIKGQTTAGNIPAGNNTYLIWTNGLVQDFELRFSYKLVYGDQGSGVQYRGTRTDGWGAQGYQADFWPAARGLTGTLSYEAPGGGGRPGFSALARPGEKVVWGADGYKRVTASTMESPAVIGATIKDGDWNDYTITAVGSHIVHRINGDTIAEMTDEDEQRRFLSGILALKLRHNKGNPMLVYFKNIRLKPLGEGTAVYEPPASKTVRWIPNEDHSQDGILFKTGFENQEGYVAGHPLFGEQGWAGGESHGHLGDGGEGVAAGLFPGSLQQAFVGGSPGATQPAIYVRLAHGLRDPFPKGGSGMVEFSWRQMITDSTQGTRNCFEWVFYKRDGGLLCGLLFDNANRVISRRYADNSLHGTRLKFTRGQVDAIKVRFDSAQNSWDVVVDNEALAVQPLVNGGGTPTPASFAIVWWSYTHLSNPHAAVAGDNLMAFDDLVISKSSAVRGQMPTSVK